MVEYVKQKIVKLSPSLFQKLEAAQYTQPHTTIPMAKLTPDPYKLFAKLVEKAKAEGKGYNDQIGMAAWAMKQLNVPPQQAIDMITAASESVTKETTWSR